MKLLINASILKKQNTGLGVYTYQVLKYVCPILRNKNIDFDILCSSKELLPDSCRKYAIENKYSNYVERNLNTIKLAQKYDLIWSTTQHGTETNKKQIITIHDVIPIIYPKGRLHQWIYYKFFLKRYIKKSVKVFTVSQSTKNDIVKYYNCKENKIKVLYEAIENNKSKIVITDDVLKSYKLDKLMYFVIVGIHYSYKNLHSVIEAFKVFEELRKYKLIIIGNDNCEYGNELKTFVKNNNLEENILFTGFIEDEVKNTLLVNCLACVYPTLYEGFGLPILEAMKLDVPVICSDSSSLPEVGGDAVLYCDSRDINDIRNKMIYISKNKNFREMLIRKGKENIMRFDWEKIAVNMVDEICEV